MLFLWEDDEALLIKVFLNYFGFFSLLPASPQGVDVSVVSPVPIPGCVSPGIVTQRCSRTGTPALGTLGKDRFWLCSHPVRGSVLVALVSLELCPLPWVPPGSRVEFALIPVLSSRAGLAPRTST